MYFENIIQIQCLNHIAIIHNFIMVKVEDTAQEEIFLNIDEKFGKIVISAGQDFLSIF